MDSEIVSDAETYEIAGFQNFAHSRGMHHERQISMQSDRLRSVPSVRFLEGLISMSFRSSWSSRLAGSLVGPRPELPEILERYPAEFAAVRAQVRPGCTGLWQISVDSKGLIFQAPQHDNYYIRSITFRLDTAILLRTIPACLSERFKTRLDGAPRQFSDAPRDWIIDSGSMFVEADQAHP
jgi:Bacterial sugar transferase